MRLPGPRPTLVLLAAAALVTASLSWWSVAWTGMAGGGSVGLSGTAGTSGLAQGLALAIGGALLLTLVVGPRGRRVVGVLCVLLFAGVAVLGALHPAPPDAAVREALNTPLADAWSASATAAPWAYAAIGALGVAASAWFTTRPGGGRAARGAGTREHELEDSLASWKAMDEGQDPTDTEGKRA